VQKWLKLQPNIIRQLLSDRIEPKYFSQGHQNKLPNGDFFQITVKLTHLSICWCYIFVTEFIFEETQAQADVLRNVLVIDNLEEKTYIPLKSGKKMHV
jgi:hypothetical protein